MQLAREQDKTRVGLTGPRGVGPLLPASRNPKTGGDNRLARIATYKGKTDRMCAKASMEEFEALLNESFEIDTPS
ncbi:MAG: hypothetical protein ACU0A0_10675, partial [Limimaricola sp.]